jgi:hypothetical protein
MPMNQLSKSAVFRPQQLSLAVEPYEILLIAVTMTGSPASDWTVGAWRSLP